MATALALAGALVATGVVDIPGREPDPPPPRSAAELPPLDIGAPPAAPPVPYIPEGDFSDLPPRFFTAPDDAPTQPFNADGAAVADRSATADLYRAPDGTLLGRFYSSPVNYRSPEGDWKRVDATLVPTEEGGWSNSAGPISFRLAPVTGYGPLLEMSGDGWSVGFDLEGAAPDRYGEAQASSVTYSDVRPGVSLHYELTSEGLKEDVVLEQPLEAGLEPLRFAMTVRGVRPKLVGLGWVSFVDANDNEVAQIPQGIATDLAGATTVVKVRARGTPEHPVVELEVDPAWLAEPSRVYPIRIA